MKKVLIVFGEIEFIKNHAVVYKVVRSIVTTYKDPEEIAELLTEYDDYIIPQLYKGTIEWK